MGKIPQLIVGGDNISVIKNLRNEAPTEYVIMFKKLYDSTIERIQFIPKRKFSLLGEPIVDLMNELLEMIFTICNEYSTQHIKLMDKPQQVIEVAKILVKIHKRLVVLWNIEHTKYTIDKMEAWADEFNLFLFKLIDYSHHDYVKRRYMYGINKKDFENLDFLRVMSEFHREVYSVLINQKYSFRISRGKLISDLADKALYSLVQANRIYPNNQEQVNQRLELIQQAFDALYAMQQPLMALFNLSEISEKSMKLISSLLNSEIRLLNKLKKSEFKRLKDFD